MYEIEIKAWDKTPAATEKLTAAFAEYEGFFDKSDVYYKQKSPPNKSVRLRVEKSFVEGKAPAEKNWVTFKQKERRSDGLEVNREIEFEVSDGGAFLQMLEGLGFELSLKKHKKTKSFHFGEFHIELVEVETLGDFVEIETLQQDESAETVKQAQDSLYEILEKCGISKDAVEKRYYSELLKLNTAK